MCIPPDDLFDSLLAFTSGGGSSGGGGDRVADGVENSPSRIDDEFLLPGVVPESLSIIPQILRRKFRLTPVVSWRLPETQP